MNASSCLPLLVELPGLIEAAITSSTSPSALTKAANLAQSGRNNGMKISRDRPKVMET